MFLILRLIVLGVLVFIVLTVFFIMQEKEQTLITFFNDGQEIAQIEVEVAKTEAELRQGLMYVEKLPEKKGMLFIFPEEKMQSFWMKNMLISLDIIFLDKDKKIVNIIKRAEPCQTDECSSYYSTDSAQYVIEVNADFCDGFNINTQTEVNFVVE